jgi:DNA polymerase III psi subunit
MVFGAPPTGGWYLSRRKHCLHTTLDAELRLVIVRREAAQRNRAQRVVTRLNLPLGTVLNLTQQRIVEMTAAEWTIAPERAAQIATAK